MYLYEYQVKKILSHYGLSIPNGVVCTNAETIRDSSFPLPSGPWLVKCQIHSGGRKTSGGVQTVDSVKKIHSFAEFWLGKHLVTNQTDSMGEFIPCILIESKICVRKEFYVGIIVDRKTQRIVFLASSQGGTEIEKIVKNAPHLVHSTNIDPMMGPQLFQGRKLAHKLELSNTQAQNFGEAFVTLSNLFIQHDLVHLEINPFVLTKQGQFECLDGKSRIDKNSLFRQNKLQRILFGRSNAWKSNRTDHHYLPLEGNIGCMSNGAGLAMGMMDSIKLHGGNPANFLDISGNTTKKDIDGFFKILLSNKILKAIFVNIFGGIVDCSMVAESIVSSTQRKKNLIPIVVRFKGNRSFQGIQTLKRSNAKIVFVTDFHQAVEKVIAIAKN